MYHYVENKKQLKRAQFTSSNLMKNLEERLRNEYGINTQFFLVGSGARNMVTQNESRPIDFDYNLNVLNGYDYDERELKECVRKAFNMVMNESGLSDVDDSTSSLTSKPICFTDDNQLQFSIDVCIVTKDGDGQWQRLIHKKTGYSYNDKYYWNTSPSSANYYQKAEKIKSVPGWWDKVRDHYLEIKNRYLIKNDYNHPSFVCYIEAINDVYNQMKQKKLIK